jgi:integrase
MRHTFAVHCLKKIDESGMDMNVALPILATYMGHTTYVGTGTYLRLSAEMYTEVSSSIDNAFGYLIPDGDITHAN